MPWWTWGGALWLAFNVLVFLGGLIRAHNRARGNRGDRGDRQHNEETGEGQRR